MFIGRRIKQSIQEAGIGNFQILDQVEDSFLERLFLSIPRNIYDDQAAEDLLYESIVSVVNMAITTEIKNVTSYIKKTVDNNLKNAIKKRKKHNEYKLFINIHGESIQMPHDNVSDYNLNEEIEKLPKRMKEVITSLLDDLTPEEIALNMGIQPESVRSHKSQAIKRLRKMWNKANKDHHK